MLAHKAVHEGHVAAEAAAGHKAAFDPQAIPSVAYTNPEIAWAGLTEREAAGRGVAIQVAKFPWAASGKALAASAGYGLTKLIFPKGGGRILGGAIVGPRAGDLIGEIMLAIELGADAIDIGRTIHPHPTFGETIGLAAEVAAGVCTDLLPA
jgi:dihydrolipoamide dehydrogenase